MNRSCAIRMLKIYISTFLLTAGMLFLNGQPVTYPWPEGIPESAYYEVSIRQDDMTYPVFTHVSLPGLEEGPDGNGINPLLEDRSLSFALFSFSGEVEVEVKKKFGSPATRVEIAPRGYAVNPSFFDGETVRFTLKRPRYVSINFVCPENRDDDGSGGKDIRHGLMIFADPPEQYQPYPDGTIVISYGPQTDSATLAGAQKIYFGPGIHRLENTYRNGRMYLQPGQQVYLEGGAYVLGSIEAGYGSPGHKIYGRGILSGSSYLWHEVQPFISFLGASETEIRGIVIENSPFHTLNVTGPDNRIERIKIINWAWNNDGIRVGPGTVVNEVFMKTMDDYDYAYVPHVVENSVIWPMRNGASGILGWGDLDGGGTRFSQNYYINAEWNTWWPNRGIIGSRIIQGANVTGDVLSNLYAEDHLSMLANLIISYDSTRGFNTRDPGQISNFLFKNILFDHPFLANNGNPVKQQIRGFTHSLTTAYVHDIQFTNLILGDQFVTTETAGRYFEIDVATTYNITFDTIGPFHYVTTLPGEGGNIVPSGRVPVPEGMNRSFSIIPAEGYRIRSVTLDGSPLPRFQVIGIDSICSDHLIEVKFEPGVDYFDLSEPASSRDQERNPSETIIYPNPSEGFVMLAPSMDNRKVNLVIVDTVGKLYYNGPVHGNRIQLPHPGVFLFYFREGNRSWVEKVCNISDSS